MIKAFSFCCALVLLSASVSYAQTEKSAGRLRTEEIFHGLDDNKRDKFSRILAAHSLIHSMIYTQETIENAVQSCAQNNPDLSENMKEGGRVFQADMSPILKKAQKALTRTLRLEEVLPRKEMEAYLALINQEALEYQKQINPVPITRQEACEKLLPKLKNEHETSRLKNLVNEAFGFDVSAE